MDYNKKFPIEKVEPNEQVWIVDFSIAPEEMKELLLLTSKVIWIDHHKTAIEKYKDFPEDIYGLRHNGIAGCELTWYYLYLSYVAGATQYHYFNNTDLEKFQSEPPYYIRLIGDRDVWKWEYGDQTKYFHNGLETLDLHPLSKNWNELRKASDNYSNQDVNPSLNTMFIDRIFSTGEAIEKYKNNQSKELLERFGYFKEWENHNCYFINKVINGEECIHIPKDWDVYIGYVFNGDKWTVSLRTEKEIDLTKIAVKYGGGGHAKACGFTCKELPWMEEIQK